MIFFGQFLDYVFLILLICNPGHHLRRLPRRLLPQVPLLRRRTVQPGRLRRLHRDVRGLRLGCPQKVAPTLFRCDEDQLLHHLRDRGGFKTTFRSLRFERMGKYPFAMSNFHRSQRNVVSQTTMAWSPCIRLGRGCDNVEENT